ncbi:MAG: carboxypeptidase regulatory-like domain-containing protein [Myxococcaceae bacterium]|nr:carboxypeptidase regulatory-like domain-containing protein [Myxococcaceae bacterium]
MRTLLVMMIASPALAASVSGRVTNLGTGVAGMEVRLWARTPKGFTFTAPNGRLVTTDATGAYAITNVPAGTYKLDTRMSTALSANYGDRWFDVAPPLGNGYLPETADELILGAADARTNVDIAVEVNGGLDGRTLAVAGGPLGGLFVRLESVADPRIHHVDVSKTTPASRLGEVAFRGMPPMTGRVVAHDPNYTRADFFGPTFTITANSNGAAGDLSIPVAPADPGEPNNRVDAGTSLDVSALRLTPPQPVTRAGAIGPRSGGDVDFFCWSAEANDRYLISAMAPFGTWPDGGVRESPWVDPVVSFWQNGARTAEDDDSGPLAFDSLLDTGVVTAGPVCVAVSTFGDTTWAGLNQGSAGPYALRVELGNRPPSITATSQGAPAPTPPATLTVSEGFQVTVDVVLSDPEQNPLTGSWELTDSQLQRVTGGTITGTTASIPFSPTQTGARRSPYTLRVTAADAEFTVNRSVLIAVNAVNVPPQVPQLQSPDAGAVVMTSRPPLVCRESVDDDADPLRYEFRLEWADGGALVESATVAGNDAGIDPAVGPWGPVSFVPQSLPENAHLQWRVRAFDGNVINGYSPWTGDSRFVVDVVNDPPAPPVLVKPRDGETLMVRRPSLEAETPLDPEGEAVSLIFEVARDSAFAQVVVVSPQVPATPGSSTTSWTLMQDLEWGGRYHARAIAVDSRGARSQPGNANAFTIRINSAPMTPIPGAPFSMGLCADQIFTTAPTAVEIPLLLDVEQDSIIVEVQVTTGADTTFAMPLFRADVMANASTPTPVSLTSVKFEEDQKYRVRMRAKDGQNVTDWVECSFTLDAAAGGTDAGSGGPTVAKSKGCGCGATDAGLLLGLVALLRRRRRA